MARNTKTEQLRGVQLFSACTDKELAQIARACDEVSVDSQAVVVEEGAAGEDFYLIVTGEAEVSRGGRPVATVGPGQYFGELSLLDESPRNATVTARTPMTLITLETTRVLGRPRLLARRGPQAAPADGATTASGRREVGHQLVRATTCPHLRHRPVR